MWYGVAADGSRQLEGLFSYDPVESQVSAARGKVQAFCSAAGKSWTYPEVELVVGLISVSAPETSEFVVASSTCRYAVVD